MLNLKDRIMDNVSFAPNGCMLWTGAIDGTGYGCIQINKIQKKAHIISYELTIGPVPDGMELDHLCRVRNCINPKHLEAVTHSENIRRGPSPNRNKTHCPKGHVYTTANTYIDSEGRRFCRECRAQRSAVWRERNKGEKS